MPVIPSLLWVYINPLNIIGAVALVLTFVNIPVFYNSLVNKMAYSALAAYLLHCTLHVPYARIMDKVFELCPYPLSLVLMLVVVAFIYTVAVLLDQPRIALWHLISKKFL